MMASGQTPQRYGALAAKIVEGRTALGFTQASFAAELGFKQQAVSRWEVGHASPHGDADSSAGRVNR